MKIIMITIVVLVGLSAITLGGFKSCDSACTNRDATRETLRKSGYTDIEPGDYAWFECGDDDRFHTQFTATNPVGQTVTGTVCCGLFSKGCTIRY